MKTKFYIAVLLLLIVGNAPAQSLDEVVARYPNEHAVMLHSNRDTRISLKDDQPFAETVEETEFIILDDKANGIYNKYKIFHGSFNELKEFEAYTKVPDGNHFKKIKVTDVKTQSSTSSGVFYDDAKESVFDFPAIAKGSVAYVTHTEVNKDAHLLMPYYFTSYMPVLSAKLTVTCPADMVLKYIIKNDEAGRVTVTQEKKGRNMVYQFTSTNQKSKEFYGDGPPRSHYEPHVIFRIASYKNSSNQQVTFMDKVDDLYRWNSAFLKDVNTLPSVYLKNLAASITKDALTDKEKAYSIYRWVQENIKYVAFENGLEGFIPRQAEDVCTRRYGDCKDMASVLTALLKLAGVKAYFTWIGTRDIPYTYTEVPLPITDNHMISTANINGEWIFLDGTDPNGIFGTPSKGIQGKQAMVGIDEQQFKVLTVPVLPAEKNYVLDSTFIAVSSNGIKGNSSIYYNGYFGVDAFNSLQYRDTRGTRDYVKARAGKGSNKFILNDFTVNKVNAADKVVNFTTNFQIPDYGKKLADEWYINMNLDRFYTSSFIDTSRRKIAVDNDFKFSLKNYTILEVPEGFELSYLPDNHQFKNDLFAYNINYNRSGNKIIAAQEFKSDCIMLQPGDFSKWNDAIKVMLSQSKKQLVLKKKPGLD